MYDQFAVILTTHSGKLMDPRFFGDRNSAESSAAEYLSQADIASAEVEDRSEGMSDEKKAEKGWTE